MWNLVLATVLLVEIALLVVVELESMIEAYPWRSGGHHRSRQKVKRACFREDSPLVVVVIVVALTLMTEVVGSRNLEADFLLGQDFSNS